MRTEEVENSRWDGRRKSDSEIDWLRNEEGDEGEGEKKGKERGFVHG